MGTPLNFDSEFITFSENCGDAINILEGIWSAMSSANKATWQTNKYTPISPAIPALWDVDGHDTFIEYYMSTYGSVNDNVNRFTTISLTPTPTTWTGRATPTWSVA